MEAIYGRYQNGKHDQNHDRIRGVIRAYRRAYRQAYGRAAYSGEVGHRFR